MNIWIIGYRAGRAVVKQNLSETGYHNLPREVPEYLRNYDQVKIGRGKNPKLGHPFNHAQGSDLKDVPKQALINDQAITQYLSQR